MTTVDLAALLAGLEMPPAAHLAPLNAAPAAAVQVVVMSVTMGRVK